MIGSLTRNGRFTWQMGRRLTMRDHDPLSFPSHLAWWDSELSAMAVNSDGTGGAPADGGNVGRWDDLSANASHLTRSVNDTAKPFYYTTWLDYEFPAVDFGQGTDGMNNNAVGAALAGVAKPFTVLTVWLTDTVVTQARYLWHLSQTSADNARAWQKFNLHSTTAGFPFIDFVRNTSTGSTERDTGNTPQGFGGSGVLHITAGVYDGTTLKTYQNGQLAHSHTCAFAGTATFATFACGCNFNGSSFNTGGPVMLSQAAFDEAFNLGQVNRLTRYFARRLSIPYSPGSGVVRVAFCGDSHFKRNRSDQDFRSWPQLFQRDGATPAEAAGMTVRAVQGAPMTTRFSALSPNVTVQWGGIKAMLGRGDFLHIKGVANDFFNCPTTGDPPDGASTNEESEVIAGLLLADMFVVIDEAIEANDCNIVVMTESPNESVAAVRVHGLNYFVETLLPAKAANYDRVIIADTFSTLVDRTADPDGLLELYDNGDNAHLNALGIAVQNTAAVAVHAPLRFDPRNIASLVRWWSGRQDSRYVDNDAVGDTDAELIDRSDTDDHAEQATAGARPTWQAAASGLLPAVRFDADDDFLTLTELELPEWTIIFAIKTGSLSSVVGHSTGEAGLVDGSGTLSMTVDSGSTVSFTHAESEHDIVVMTSDGRAWANGVPLAGSGGVADPTITIDQIGKSDAGPSGDMDLDDLMIADEVLGVAEINQIGQYLAGQYTRRSVAKTWTNITS